MRYLKNFREGKALTVTIILVFIILVPFVRCQANERIPPEESKNQKQEIKVQKTLFSMDLYGYIDGIEPGDLITVMDPDGIVCGIFEVKKDGQYGFVHVYGDDPTTDMDEGAQHGDILTFQLNGNPLEGPEVIWIGDSFRKQVDF